MKNLFLLRWLMPLMGLLLWMPDSFGAMAQTPAPGAEAVDPPALLVADRVFITGDSLLVAEGNVEAFQGDVRLRASRITFDRASGKLSVEGPIRIDQGETSTILADSAELDEGLLNGLLSGARLVLDEQLQLAAVQMTRVGGRYTQLDKTSVTSCRVCNDDSAPLWQIRARRVIHDQQERQLYFEGAQFRVLDVPIFYFPSLRLPDPTLDRAAGFLVPSIRTTSQLGTGLILPYFIPIGDSADVTVTPYVSSKTKTLNLRYRQAFKQGWVDFEGAYTRDDLIPGESRGYLFGAGQFDLARDFVLTFDIETTSDDAYLVDYGVSDADRLESEIALSKTERDAYFRVGLIHYNSLRDGEDEATLPTQVADIIYERRFFPTQLGGELRFDFDAHAHFRTSDEDIVGRDIKRATADIQWLRTWITPMGIRADFTLDLAADIFGIDQDSDYESPATRVTPATAFSLRYPMTKTVQSGATHFLEPVFQVAWSDVIGDPVPNDESGFVEFDTGNLLSLSRFPAPDRREDGLILAYGVNWSRFSPSGWQSSLAAGQVFHQTADSSFTSTSGLSGNSSDFLLAGQLKTQKGLGLTARTLFDDAFSFSKAELRGNWIGKRSALTGTYLWLQADAEEDRTEATSEIWLDGTYQLSPNWSASADWRYDISDDRATEAGVGLVYQNECVQVDLSVNRRYTSSTSVEPSTDIGFTIALRGFSVDGGTELYRRVCS